RHDVLLRVDEGGSIDGVGSLSVLAVAWANPTASRWCLGATLPRLGYLRWLAMGLESLAPRRLPRLESRWTDDVGRRLPHDARTAASWRRQTPWQACFCRLGREARHGGPLHQLTPDRGAGMDRRRVRTSRPQETDRPGRRQLPRRRRRSYSLYER